MDTLRKEAISLKRELNESTRSKLQADKNLESLKKQYIHAKVSNEEEMEKNNQEQQELKNLRKIKSQL